jgi:hypothetical protein
MQSVTVSSERWPHFRLQLARKLYVPGKLFRSAPNEKQRGCNQERQQALIAGVLKKSMLRCSTADDTVQVTKCDDDECTGTSVSSHGAGMQQQDQQQRQSETELAIEPLRTTLMAVRQRRDFWTPWLRFFFKVYLTSHRQEMCARFACARTENQAHEQCLRAHLQTATSLAAVEVDMVVLYVGQRHFIPRVDDLVSALHQYELSYELVEPDWQSVHFLAWTVRKLDLWPYALQQEKHIEALRLQHARSRGDHFYERIAYDWADDMACDGDTSPEQAVFARAYISG